MSTSPVPPQTAQSQKRPLEEPSSDTGFEDQPDAKRPALEKGLPHENDKSQLTNGAAANDEPSSDAAVKSEGIDLKEEDGPVANGSTTAHGALSQNEVLHTQPIQSTAAVNGTGSGSPFPNQQVDETNWLHVRAIISSAEAATVIGKGGENVTLIRRMSGAKCTVSDYSRGAVERVLTVSGLPDAIAKAFGLIIRTLNQESLETPSDATSKPYPLRLLVPHILIGSIIGQKGTRIREIQEASGARLNASESTLPLSTERSLIVLGVADAVHIATYYICSTLVEQLTDRFGGPAASAYATRSGGPAGVVPGGMQVVPYTPQPASGQWGHLESYSKHPTQQAGRQPANAYGIPYAQRGPGPQQQHQNPAVAMQYGPAQSPRHAYGGPAAPVAQAYGQQQPVGPQTGYPAVQGQQQQPLGGGPVAALPGQPLTQQIFIPNDMVGAIIGKGGAKINEIRQLSGSVIKINEPQDNSNERLVTITGTQECNQMALYMLYQRLGQSQANPPR